MITFFCPKCWKKISKDDERCPFCNADITDHSNKDFVEKLLNALNHPERETVQRAVWILGRLKIEKAVNPLKRLFGQVEDPYIKREILIALDHISVPEAIAFIEECLQSKISIVRRKAQDIMKKRAKI